MTSSQRYGGVFLMLAGFASLAAGCNGFIWEREEHSKVDLGVAPEKSRGERSAAVRDTIGSVAYFEGTGAMRVRGYGLVVGLGENGSRDCPKYIYNQLVASLYKQHRFSKNEVGVKSTSPEKLIDSPDSAVVTVFGRIPAGLVAGAPFDAVVRALSGTQTKSLRGGWLLPADLEVFRDTAGRGTITGQALARAAGPIFVNPFSDDQSPTQSNPREGMILGGAVATQDRRVRLVLIKPSYALASQIENRINVRFPGPAKTADAISPSFIRLRIPQQYHREPGRFLSLVRKVYRKRDPRFEVARARALSEELQVAGAPYADIALCFEGLGALSALPTLGKLYADTRDFVSFHAGVAGLRLEDHLAGDAIARHATDPMSPYRFQAIRALGEATGMAGPAMTLRELLADRDPRVQIAAYEGLARRGDTSVQTAAIGKGNFTLTLVPKSETNFIYAKRSGARRIVLFGKELRCTPPALYVSPDGSLIITGREGDETLTVVRRVAATRATSERIPVHFDLPPLVRLMGSKARVEEAGRVTGLGLDYGAVVRALYQLCADGSINARFVLEQPNVAELFGPPRPAGRPESEL